MKREKKQKIKKEESSKKIKEEKPKGFLTALKELLKG